MVYKLIVSGYLIKHLKLEFKISSATEGSLRNNN